MSNNSNKFGNRKTFFQGKVYDSKKEQRRAVELQWLVKAGEIKNLREQVPFELLPSQRVDGKVVERPCKYIADFVYEQDGKTVVEDTKGFRTPEYIIKRKLMLHRYGIQVKEI